jgi:hypothetical protein
MDTDMVVRARGKEVEERALTWWVPAMEEGSATLGPKCTSEELVRVRVPWSSSPAARKLR